MVCHLYQCDCPQVLCAQLRHHDHCAARPPLPNPRWGRVHLQWSGRVQTSRSQCLWHVMTLRVMSFTWVIKSLKSGEKLHAHNLFGYELNMNLSEANCPRNWFNCKSIFLLRRMTNFKVIFSLQNSILSKFRKPDYVFVIFHAFLHAKFFQQV